MSDYIEKFYQLISRIDVTKNEQRAALYDLLLKILE